MQEKITSTQNPRIKRIVQLSAKPKERRLAGLMVIEGFREIKMAAESGFVITELYFCPELATNRETLSFTGGLHVPVYEISPAVFEKIAYREHSDGLIALAQPKFIKIGELKLSANPLILVLESVEKPGNLGALLRTADAGLLDAVIVCDPQTDIYNSNVIRSSLGCIFTKQVVTCTTDEALHFFREKNIKTFAAALTATRFYHQTDFRGPSAIVMGTESTGLTTTWLNAADDQIKIPMNGKVDSLNVSTSAAILVFEALRQRDFR